MGVLSKTIQPNLAISKDWISNHTPKDGKYIYYDSDPDHYFKFPTTGVKITNFSIIESGDGVDSGGHILNTNNQNGRCNWNVYLADQKYVEAKSGGKSAKWWYGKYDEPPGGQTGHITNYNQPPVKKQYDPRNMIDQRFYGNTYVYITFTLATNNSSYYIYGTYQGEKERVKLVVQYEELNATLNVPVISIPNSSNNQFTANTSFTFQATHPYLSTGDSISTTLYFNIYNRDTKKWVVNDNPIANCTSGQTTSWTSSLDIAGNYLLRVEANDLLSKLSSYSDINFTITASQVVVGTAVINSVNVVNNKNLTAKVTINATAGTGNTITSYWAGYTTTPDEWPDSWVNSSTSNVLTVTVPSARTYYFVGFIYSTNNNASKYSNAITITNETPSYGKCGAPGSVSISLTNAAPRQVKVSWTAGLGGTNNPISYYFWRVTGSSSLVQNLPAGITQDASTLNGIGTLPQITTSPQYFYGNVITVGTQNGYNSDTKTSSGLTVTKCTSPTRLDAILDGTSGVSLTYSGASNGTNNIITGYNIGYSTSSTATSPSSTIETTPNTNYSYSNLSKGTYYFFVRAYAPFNNGDWIKTSITISAAEKCKAPETVTATFVDGKIKVDWFKADGGANNNLKGYGLKYSKTINGKTIQSYSLDTNQTTGYTLLNLSLEEGETYYFAIQTRGTAGENYYSDYTWSNALTIQSHSHPIVNSGDIITKDHMDALRAYKGNTANTITQENLINAIDGRTYDSTIQIGDELTAEWYNNL